MEEMKRLGAEGGGKLGAAMARQKTESGETMMFAKVGVLSRKEATVGCRAGSKPTVTSVHAQLDPLKSEDGGIREGGEDWTKKEAETVASQWKQRLLTGGFSVTVYAIDEAQILITLSKG